MLAMKSSTDEYIPCQVTDLNGLVEFNSSMLMEELYKRKKAGEDKSDLAKIFHNSLIEGASEIVFTICRGAGIDQVVLSGGVFQNRIMLSGMEKKLASLGLRVFINRKIPSNDAGISAGQAIYGVYNA